MASNASTYTRTNLLNALLRGVAFPLPANTYVSLHTADPGATGANEETVANFPAYARRKAETAAIGTGWGAPSGDASKNSNQLTFPGMNGGAAQTVTHWGLWDAATGGNFLTGGPLQTARTLQVGDVFVFDVNSITVSAA